jgi:hypothetical protein
MSQRSDDLLALYREHRFDEQYAWYEDRITEYERAHDQIITVTAAALFGAAAAGLAASADVAGLRIAWAVLAAVLSGSATLVAAYDQLIAYEQNLKVYRDARAALGSLRPDAPWLSTPVDLDQARHFVDEAERVFRSENGQWGQLTSAYTPPDARTDGPSGSSRTDGAPEAAPTVDRPAPPPTVT